MSPAASPASRQARSVAATRTADCQLSRPKTFGKSSTVEAPNLSHHWARRSKADEKRVDTFPVRRRRPLRPRPANRRRTGSRRSRSSRRSADRERRLRARRTAETSPESRGCSTDRRVPRSRCRGRDGPRLPPAAAATSGTSPRCERRAGPRRAAIRFRSRSGPTPPAPGRFARGPPEDSRAAHRAAKRAGPEPAGPRTRASAIFKCWRICPNGCCVSLASFRSACGGSLWPMSSAVRKTRPAAGRLGATA